MDREMININANLVKEAEFSEFEKDGENVDQGTGQITTFNQLSFKEYSDKPDGWCLPKNMNDVAIIRGLNIRNFLENTPTKITAPTLHT